MKRSLSVVAALSLSTLGMVLIPSVASAVVNGDCHVGKDTWKGGDSGQENTWHDDANWTNSVPTSGTDVCINGGAAFQPIFSASDDTIASLTMTGGTLTVRRALTVTSLVILDNNANVTVSGGGTLNATAGVFTDDSSAPTATLTLGDSSSNPGTLRLGGSSALFSGPVTTGKHGAIVGNGTNSIQAPLTVPSGDDLTLTGPGLHLTKDNNVVGDVLLGASTPLFLDNGTTNLGGTIKPAGTLGSNTNLTLGSTATLFGNTTSPAVHLPVLLQGTVGADTGDVLTFDGGSGTLAASSPSFTGGGTVALGSAGVADDTHPLKLTGDLESLGGNIELDGVSTTGAITADQGIVSTNGTEGLPVTGTPRPSTQVYRSNSTGNLTGKSVELASGAVSPGSATDMSTSSNTVGAVKADEGVFFVSGKNTATSTTQNGATVGPFGGVEAIAGTNGLGPVTAVGFVDLINGTNSGTTVTSPDITVEDGTNTFGDLSGVDGNDPTTDGITIKKGTNSFGKATTDGYLEVDAGTNTFSGALSAGIDASLVAGTNKAPSLHADHDVEIDAGTNTLSGPISAGHKITVKDGTNQATTVTAPTILIANGGNTFTDLTASGSTPPTDDSITIQAGGNHFGKATTDGSVEIDAGSNTFTGAIQADTVSINDGQNGGPSITAATGAVLSGGQNTFPTISVTDPTVVPSGNGLHGLRVGGPAATKTTATTLSTNTLTVYGNAAATLTVSGAVTVLGKTDTGDNAHVSFTSTTIKPSLGTDLSIDGTTLYDATSNDYGLAIAYPFTNSNPLVVNGNLLVDGGLLQVNAGNGSVQVPAATGRTTVLGNDGALNTSVSSDAPTTIGGYRAIRGVLTLNNAANTLTDGANVLRSGATGSSAAGTISIPAGKTLTATPPASGTPVGDKLYVRTDVSGTFQIPTNTSLDLGTSDFPGIAVQGGGLTNVDGTITAGVINNGANGKVTGQGTVFTLNNNAGTVQPGNLSANTYTQGSTAKLEVHYSGGSPKPVSGITATGAVSLAGQLDIVTGSPAPVSDDTFHIVTGSVITGDFDTKTGVNFGTGLSYQLVKATGDYSATVTDVSTQLKLVTDSPSQVVDGSSFKLTATVSNAKTFPRGQVTFTSDGRSIGTVDLTPTANNQSTAQLDTPDLKPTPTGSAVGNHKIVATYSTSSNGLLTLSSDTIVQKVVSVPSPARTLTSTNGDGTLTIGWAVPDNDGNSPIDGYVLTVTPRSGGGAPTVVSLPASTTTTTVPGLVNGQAYDVSVKAHNAIGFALPLLSTTPLQPDHVTVTLAAGPAVITSGSTSKLTGTVSLTNVAPGRGLTVKLTATTADGVVTQVGTTTSDPTGKFSLTVSPKTNTTFTVTSGEDTLGPNATSAPVKVSVKFLATVTSATFNKSNGKLSVKGKLTPRSGSLVISSKTKATIKVINAKGKVIKTFKGSIGASSTGNTISGSTTYTSLAAARYLVEIDVIATKDNAAASSGQKSFTLKTAYAKKAA